MLPAHSPDDSPKPGGFAFDYSALAVEHREHVRSAAGEVRLLAYRAACNMVRVGLLLADVRRRLKKLTFRRWIVAELPWSRTHTYRLIAVGEVFGPLLSPDGTERIEPSALYMLARTEVPSQARAYAVELARDQLVTVRDAREILAAHRNAPDLGKDELRAHEERMKPVRAEENADRRRVGADVQRAANSWEAFRSLVESSTMVHIAVLTEEGGDLPLYSATMYSEDARPRSVVRRSLCDVIVAATGSEQEAPCASCNILKPLSLFSNNKSLPSGKSRNCKACERTRLGIHKKHKRAEAQAAGAVQGPDGSDLTLSGIDDLETGPTAFTIVQPEQS